MAQVVDYYRAVAGNSGYGYQYADGRGTKKRIEKGTVLTLNANYADKITNGRYYIRSHACWLNWTYVDDIKPVYKTVTDKCTAPDGVTIDAAKKQMTITGGAGGDLNTLTGFGIQWRERGIKEETWGSWSTESVIAGRTMSVDANPGMVRQYQVRTQGSAGSAYYSAWVVCPNIMIGNTAAATPTILLPGMNRVTGSKTPVVVVSCSADNEGDQMTLKRRLDSGEYADAAAVPGTGATIYDRLPELSSGEHTITYKVVDANGGESEEASVMITQGSAAWTRSIASGDVIANETISHVKDVEEMLLAVNVQRMYYGLEPITLPGTVGLFADWGRQMQSMLDGTCACLLAAGQTVATHDVIGEWPNAETINMIRNRALQV